ncbi:MAG: Sapep family Mn(2+)-dependent dipeptidase [Oscillospiraceae bacterium]|jgi:succinyl-diaminopimelate desuccinylase|nr:Sapep family Mn(2+)-dependent dipeptidase [Oscillospiraceae bacterium]
MGITTEIKGKIDDWFAANADKLIADLTQLINTKSVLDKPEAGAPYGRGARDALDLSREILRKLGIETEVFEDCMAEGDIGDGAELGILVHVDTVAANPDEWQSDPFVTDIRDGVIYGRGATDNKGPAIAAFYALACANALTGGLKKGAKILVGSAEEIGCVDITRWLEVNTPPRYVFAPDASYPICNVEKGRFVLYFEGKWDASGALPRVTALHGGGTSNIIPGAASASVRGLKKTEIEPVAAKLSAETGAEFLITDSDSGVKIVCNAKAAHASLPWNGNNAQTALLALLAALPLAEGAGAEAIRNLARLFPHGDCYGEAVGIAQKDEVSGVLTLSFNVLELNETGFTANFDSRTTQSADSFPTLDTAKNALETAGFAVTNHTMTQCHVTETDGEFVQTLLGIYREYTGDDASRSLALGGTTYVHNIPGGVAFGTEKPGVNNRIHGRDEFITVDELLTSAKMFAAAVVAICG